MYQQQPMMQYGTPKSQQGPALPYQMPQHQYVPGTPMPVPPGFSQQMPFTPPTEPGRLPLEQSYIENILRLNRGKVGTFYMTFENNTEWNAKIFRGIVAEAGRDHIIISDPQSGKYYLLLMLNLDYVVFDEPIEYEYPFNGGPLAAYPPR